MYLEAVFGVSLSVSMTFRGRNVFFRFFFCKNFFFIILYPKNVKKGMSPTEVWSFVFVCFFLKLIFLYFIACFNIVVTWGGEKNEV